jgi:hypothetical protein
VPDLQIGTALYELKGSPCWVYAKPIPFPIRANNKPMPYIGYWERIGLLEKQRSDHRHPNYNGARR